MKSVFISLFLCLGAEILSAESPSGSFDACLHPASDGDQNTENCPLIPLEQGLDVSGCRFLPGRTEMLGQAFLTIMCTISNRSEERLASIEYAVRYMETGSSTILEEVGFSSALLVPVLKPQDTRSIRLVAPDLPNGAIASEVDVFVEARTLR